MLIGYARVSTDDQNTQLQTDALERAGCNRIFREKASGAKTDRPELARVLDTLRKGDVLVVWKLDRLGRSLPHLIELVADFETRGIGFRSLTENIDTTSATGRMFFHMMGALAQFERDRIRERTLAGLVAARAQGRFGGRPPSPYPPRISRRPGPPSPPARAWMRLPGGSVSRDRRSMPTGCAGMHPHHQSGDHHRAGSGPRRKQVGGEGPSPSVQSCSSCIGTHSLPSPLAREFSLSEACRPG